MKKFNLTIARKILLASTICMTLSVTSCIPDPVSNNGVSDGNGEDEKPVLKDPEGTKSIGLYMESSDNIAGLYFSTEGYLTSSNGWRLSYAGNMNCISYVDFIPRNTWTELLHVSVGDGFVGYLEGQGFTRFYVAGAAVNDNGAVVGLLIKFVSTFYGKDEAPELALNSIEMTSDGGAESISINNKTYTVFQSMSSANWCRVVQRPSIFPYIIDGIEIQVEPNTEPTPRETDVVLSTHGGKTTILKVKQEAAYIEE